MRHRLPSAGRLRCVLFAAALTLAGTPAFALERGEFEDGLYTAPDALFTVRSPLGPHPWVIDSFDRHAGAVTFVDADGQLFGIICTPSFDPLAGADNDAETDLAILRNWLRDATFPLFFERQLPGAALLHDAPATFEGRPAWTGVMYLPHGGTAMGIDAASGLPMRQDSYRGLVVFSRGDHTFLLMTEIAPQAEWNAFLPALSEFYHGIAFATPTSLPADTHLASR